MPPLHRRSSPGRWAIGGGSRNERRSFAPFPTGRYTISRCEAQLFFTDGCIGTDVGCIMRGSSAMRMIGGCELHLIVNEAGFWESRWRLDVGALPLEARRWGTTA